MLWKPRMHTATYAKAVKCLLPILMLHSVAARNTEDEDGLGQLLHDHRVESLPEQHY